jgi:hypothetical protein
VRTVTEAPTGDNPSPLFAKLNAYPMVLRLDSIAVDVEFLPLIAPVFYDDDVDPAIEIQVRTHRGTAVEFVCQSQQKCDVRESLAASMSWCSGGFTRTILDQIRRRVSRASR